MCLDVFPAGLPSRTLIPFYCGGIRESKVCPAVKRWLTDLVKKQKLQNGTPETVEHPHTIWTELESSVPYFGVSGYLCS